MVEDKKVQKLISEMVKKIVVSYNPSKIILFGSYAYGKPTEESDIDLFIIKETEKRRTDRFCEVRKILRDIQGVSIQPVVFTKAELNNRLKIKDDFILEIMEKGEVLYG